MKTNLLATIAVLILLAAMAWVGKQESDLAADDHAHYCEMIRIHKESRGAYGWPDDGRDCR